MFFTLSIRILLHNSTCYLFLFLLLTDSPSVSIIEKQVVLEQGSVTPEVSLFIFQTCSFKFIPVNPDFI